MEPGRSSPYWLDRCCLRPSTESRHSRCRILRRSITLPARTAADASPAPSQVPTHGSRRNVDWLLLRSEGLSPSVICQLAWRSYPRVPPGIPQNARQSRFPPPPTPLTPRGPPPRLSPGPAIEGPAACGRRAAVPSRLPAARLPVESPPARQHARRYADDPGTRTRSGPAFTADWPAAGRSAASASAS